MKIKSITLIISFLVLSILSSCAHKIVQGNWSAIEPLPTARSFTTANYIDGKIYICGGSIDTWAHSYVDIYDIDRGEWLESTKLPEDRFKHASVLVDGELWLIGGQGSPVYHNNAIIWNHKKKQWEEIARLPWHMNHIEAENINGEIFVTGGLVAEMGNKPTAATLKLNKEKNQFEEIAAMNSPRFQHSTAVHNGKLYAFGGVPSRGFPPINTAEVFDPETGNWKNISPMPVSRRLASSIGIGEYIILIGGLNDECVDESLSRVDIYIPSEDKWIEGKPMLNPRMTFSITTDGSAIYVFGGSIKNNQETATDLSEVYRF